MNRDGPNELSITPLQAKKALGLANLSEGALTRIADHFWDRPGGSDVMRGVARHPSLGRALMDRLQRHPVDSVRMHLSHNQKISASAMRALARDKSVVVRYWVAQSPYLSVSEVIRMTRDPETQVAGQALANPRLPANLINAAARSRVVWRRVSVAANPSISPELLARLLRDACPDVARWALLNSSAPTALLVEASAMPEEQRRAFQRTLFSHPRLPIDALMRCAETSPLALSCALRREDCPQDVMRAYAWKYPEEVGLNPRAPRDVLDAFARARGEGDFFYRHLVVANPACPADLLTLLAEDDDGSVREEARRRRNGDA